MSAALSVDGPMVQKHRANFDDGLSEMKNKLGKNMKLPTPTRWLGMIKLAEDYVKFDNIEDPKEKSAFGSEAKKEHGTAFYTLGARLKVEVTTNPSTNEDVKVLFRTESDQTDTAAPQTWLKVVHDREVFEVIWRCHALELGHKKTEQTYATLREKYHSISRQLVKLCVDTCPTCQKKAQKVPRLKGALHPIPSSEFRNWFQFDLIDMQLRPAKDVHGIVMKWILTIKDHFTKFVVLRALPSKEAKYTAAAIHEVFGLLGCPLIYHTDNGQEFVAKQVLDLVKEWNPQCVTVQGRPRRPSDQGSVENMNHQVKKVLTSMEEDCRTNGNPNPNWVFLLSRAMAALNSSKGLGKNDQSPYFHLFGMPYEHKYLANADPSLVREATTVAELARAIPDNRLNQQLQANYAESDPRAELENVEIEESVSVVEKQGNRVDMSVEPTQAQLMTDEDYLETITSPPTSQEVAEQIRSRVSNVWEMPRSIYLTLVNGI